MNSRYISKILLVATLLACVTVGQSKRGSFSIVGDQFLLNGKPTRIYSGEIHYPRVPKEYWKDRLIKARAMGLNSVCTYVFWNLHEPSPGSFDFSGNLDIAEFVRIAKDAGLNVIIRPGPYVCSEWDLGGIPSWLLKDRDIALRCMDPRYLKASERYLRRLARELAPLQIDRGGPIVMFQVENEYGSYGNDKEYLQALERIMRSNGLTVPFFTSDGGAQHLLRAGSLPNVLPVVNFGGGAMREFAELEKFRSGLPKMCGEYWCGWFTHWGDAKWGSADIDKQKEDVRWMLETGKSFNFYMFHGGTNFGWMAGANYSNRYEPDITSYDYDAPLDERGTPKPKYFVLRDLLRKHQPEGTVLPEIPAIVEPISIPEIQLREEARLMEMLPRPTRTPQPRPMEVLGQDYGFILYRTKLVGPTSGTLQVTEPHDYALVFVDGVFIDTLDRSKGKFSTKLPESTNPEPTLDILVEAMGRINFGQHLIDRKGITERVTLRGVTLMNWEDCSLPMTDVDRKQWRFGPITSKSGPKIFRGEFTLTSTGDTFLDLSAWSKGVVWVNGKNLGRYWNIGPQQRLFVPGPWLRAGKNEIVVFDLFANRPARLRGVDAMTE